MCNLFDSTKKTNESQQSQQTGQSTTTGNIWPQIQPFVSSFLQSAQNANVQPNQYQLAAGNQQTGVAGALAPAQNVALDVSQQGLRPSDITPFMDPYIASVVNPTLTAQQIQNQQAISSLRGNQAVRGALGNNTGSEAAYYAGVQPAQQAQIASLYSQGYGQAANLAAQSKGIQLQGAQTAGGLSNAATGANSALGNIGQGVASTELQNALIPTQYAAAISPLSGAAGSHTESSGTSTGTGTSTSTYSPSLWDQGKNIVSAGASIASLFSDRRIKENIKPIGKTFDGQPIYKYNIKGSPATEIGLMAQDVEKSHPDAVGSVGGIKTVNYDKATKEAEPFASGGAVGEMTPFHHSDDMVTKVGKAFHALHKMRKMAEGGGVDERGDSEADKRNFDNTMMEARYFDGQMSPREHEDARAKRALEDRLEFMRHSEMMPSMKPRFDIGGDVGLGSWDATVSGPSFMDSVGNFGKDLGKVSSAMGDGKADPLLKSDDANMLAGSQQALSSFLNGVTSANRMTPRYDDGGAVPDSWWSRAAKAIVPDSWRDAVPDAVMTGIEGGKEFGRRIGMNPEGVVEGIGQGLINATPLGYGMQSVAPLFKEAIHAAPQMMRGMNSADSEPSSIAGDAPPSGAMPALYDGNSEFSGPVDTGPRVASNEPSSIASKEVLPWKLGAGAVPPPASGPMAPPAKSDPVMDILSKVTGAIPTPMSDGVWQGKPMTPWQRAMFSLSRVGDFKPFGDSMLDLGEQRFKEAENRRAEELQPARVEIAAAEAKSKAQEASLDFQIKAAQAMGDVKREQELLSMKTFLQFSKDNNLANSSGMPAQTGEPPIEGAKQASDGNWYIPDPDRPGKYLMVQP